MLAVVLVSALAVGSQDPAVSASRRPDRAAASDGIVHGGPVPQGLAPGRRFRFAGYSLVAPQPGRGFAISDIGAGGSGLSVYTSREGVVRISTPTAPTTSRAAATPACDDKAHAFEGGTKRDPWGWDKAYKWYFRSSSLPSSLDEATVETVLQTAMDGVTTGNNDCGLVDEISAQHSYMGTTTKKPGCPSGTRDRVSEVGFTSLPNPQLGLACTHFASLKGRPWQIIEADVVFSTNVRWTTEPDCLPDLNNPTQWPLEDVAAHESAHAFGLDHVTASQHAELTMYPTEDCRYDQATYGKGDVVGLRKLY